MDDDATRIETEPGGADAPAPDTAPDGAEGGDEIRETDIVFDCPSCGESLAIDYRGAGLNLVCPHCGVECAVPFPQGMEIGDLDSTAEEQEIRIINLRNMLERAEADVTRLAVQVDDLSVRYGNLQQAQDALASERAQIREKVAQIQRAQAEIYRALDAISDIVGDAEA